MNEPQPKGSGLGRKAAFALLGVVVALLLSAKGFDPRNAFAGGAIVAGVVVAGVAFAASRLSKNP